MPPGPSWSPPNKHDQCFRAPVSTKQDEGIQPQPEVSSAKVESSQPADKGDGRHSAIGRYDKSPDVIDLSYRSSLLETLKPSQKTERTAERQRRRGRGKRKAKATAKLHQAIKHSLALLRCFFWTLAEHQFLGFRDTSQQEAYEGLVYLLLHRGEYQTLALKHFFKGDTTTKILKIDLTPSRYTCG